MVDTECSILCRNGNDPSPFKTMNLEQLEDFQWEILVSELTNKAPTLWKLLSTLVGHSDKRNQLKHGTLHHPAICMAVAMVLKERNKNMTGLQTLISLVLFKYRVQKQVSRIPTTHNTH